MDATEARPFAIDGPLPTGTTVLEASAGTGKTYAIAGLAARYLAEGWATIDQMLLLTFSRSAARELRGRVRDRLLSVDRGLRSWQEGGRRGAGAASRDVVLDVLLEGARRDQVAARRARVRRAVAAFDSATIATIHQFCNQANQLIGLAGSSESGERFDENPLGVVHDALEAVYLSGVGGEAWPFSLDDATAIATAVGGAPDDVVLLPTEAAAADSSAAPRRTFALRVRESIRQRRERQRVYGHDDQLTRLRDALRHPVTGATAVGRLREHYAVALIDEFQDTDPIQWEILQTVADGYMPLVLIGDPKQAIYGFRGADVHTYLRAREHGSTLQTLDRNFRSDPIVVAGVGHLLGAARLGDERIQVRPVGAARSGTRLTGAGSGVEIRLLRRDGARLTQDGLLSAGDARAAITRDTTRQVVELLDGGARVLTQDGERPVAPQDIAVLVGTHREADLVHDHLVAAGIPTVIAGTRDVFASEAARHWSTLLDAIEQPGRSTLLRTAALTPLIGVDPAEVADGGTTLDAFALTQRRRHRVWRDAGVMALHDVLVADGMLSRLLALPDGDRLATDARHVAEVLHEAAVDGGMTMVEQRHWLAEQQRGARNQDDGGERSRRLETDARAVQIMTIHAAKGLEFPIVLLPFVAMQYRDGRLPGIFSMHYEGRRALHVGGAALEGSRDAWQASMAESAGEDLRKLYVALTRAACKVTVWWAATTLTSSGGLHRMLLSDRSDAMVPDTLPVSSDDVVERSLRRLADTSHGTVAVNRVPSRASAGSVRWVPPPPSTAPLSVARFDRSLDNQWRRTSYSGLTTDLYVPHPVAEPEKAGTTDESTAVSVPLADRDDGTSAEATEHLRSTPTMWADLPAGARFGTLVHEVVESVDFATADLAEEVSRTCRAHRGFSATTMSALPDALLGSLSTPLGDMFGSRRLRDLPASDRLAELNFELPLAGGDRARPSNRAALLADLAALLRDHLAPADPLSSYPDRLDAEGVSERQLRGYLVGSIDAVFRVPDDAGSGAARHVVVDYKTNLLRAPDGSLTAWDYRPAALAAAMLRAHYPLQALLYTVAVHRFLRWRVADYEPRSHLGGVQYHFLRGMVGPASALPNERGQPSGDIAGVFSWQPPPQLVEELSTLLAGGKAR